MTGYCQALWNTVDIQPVFGLVHAGGRAAVVHHHHQICISCPQTNNMVTNLIRSDITALSNKSLNTP